MVFSYCKCSYHLAGNENAAANFYNTHFVPDGWELVYSKLSECRSIHLKGRCKDCYGDLNEMIPLPEGLSGDALFQAIYDAMWSAHPYRMQPVKGNPPHVPLPPSIYARSQRR